MSYEDEIESILQSVESKTNEFYADYYAKTVRFRNSKVSELFRILEILPEEEQVRILLQSKKQWLEGSDEFNKWYLKHESAIYRYYAEHYNKN